VTSDDLRGALFVMYLISAHLSNTPSGIPLRCCDFVGVIDELPFEEEILAFLRYLRHSGEIKKIIDVNINKLHKPWRSFAAVINKCPSGKSTGYDNFVHQVEHKDAKKSNEMYYPKFTKVIINFFMTKDPLIPRRNKFGAMLPVELTNEDIKNSVAYKEYYAIALGAAPSKTKANVRKT
nr:hypothetical protein [Tanacetum cinerariifolium]